MISLWLWLAGVPNVEVLFTTVANPRGGLKSMGKKLAKGFIRHWWKHVTQKNLEDVKIYDSVRVAISAKFRSDMYLVDQTASARSRLPAFALATFNNKQQCWC